jgi:primosomal protein N' (replication factor Y)
VCSLGDALKATLPQGLTPGSEAYYSIACDDEGRLAGACGKSVLKRQIVDALRTGEVLSAGQLRELTGVQELSAQLRDLERAGIVTVERSMEQPQVRIKTMRVARIVPGWTDADRMQELTGILEKRAPKQVDILATLWNAWRNGITSMPVRDLLVRSRAGTAQLNSLAEKEVVEIFEQEDVRVPPLKFAERVREIVLNSGQQTAVDAIASSVESGGFHSFLLHGVTASGKTQVYIEAIKRTLAAGRNALVLVPEIALTPQLVFRFQTAFGNDVTVSHSRMSPGERFDSWRRTLAGAYKVVIGVRAAVFAPLSNIGLVVVDEEHEPSYKQSDLVPRYNARDCAVMRASISGATVVLGTATPSVESTWNVSTGKYTLLSLPSRVDGAVLPAILPVDMTAERRMRRVQGSLSMELIDRLRVCVQRGEGAIVFQNRRGYAPHIECPDCGHVEECSNCSISLTYHKDRDRLRCHYCGAAKPVPVTCPRCGSTELQLMGAGTQRIEEELRDAIPEARIVRMDLDSTRRRGAHDMMLTAFSEGEADILVGTQMVARGLDFDRVTLVGIVTGEQSLLFPDFRAGERTFQLLTQVSGRAGRGGLPGTVVLQTTRPQHPVFQHVMNHSDAAFMEEELASRRELNYPPFSRLAILTFSSTHEDDALKTATMYNAELRRYASFYSAYPPQPALIRKVNNRYRFTILLRINKKGDPDGSRLSGVLKAVQETYLKRSGPRSVRIDVDVDPGTV